MKTIHVPKTALYTVLSVIVLLVLLVGGGIAYVWYTGQEAPEVSQAAMDKNNNLEASAPPQPTKPAANANASASVQLLTSPVAPGENVSMSIKTVPTATCTIKVEYNGVASTDSGLVAKTADEYGIVEWTWTVDASVPLGTWPATVTCVYNGRTAVVRGDLVVAR